MHYGLVSNKTALLSLKKSDSTSRNIAGDQEQEWTKIFHLKARYIV